MPTVNKHRHFVIHPINFVVNPVGDFQGFRNRHPGLFHRKRIKPL